MNRTPIPDPVETIVADALREAGVAFTRHVGRQGPTGRHLDFHLDDYDVFIECKQFHSERVLAQMASVGDVIVIQGITAARTFALLLGRAR